MSGSAAKNAFGDEHLLGGKTDPRVAPGCDAPRGSIYILARGSGSILVLQKQDSGKTVNWLPMAGPASLVWAASILLNFDDADGAKPIYTVQSGDRIVAAKAFVQTAWDGAPSLTVGNSGGAADSLMQAAEVNLLAANIYTAERIVVPLAGEIIQATYARGGATQGQAVIAVQKLIVTGAL